MASTAFSTFLAEPETGLVERARRGEIEAIEQIYDAYASSLYNLARRICASPEDAEEVLQETFLELSRSLRKFKPGGSFAVWVRRIAVNKAISRLRREKLRDHASLDDPMLTVVPSAARPAARGVDLERALASLSQLSRTVVWLHEVEGYTHREIGKLLGRTTSFSKSQLARAHTRMRAVLVEAGEAQ